MSYVVAAPEAITGAAENLASIDSALGDVTAATAAATTELAPAAADEISLAISRLFGSYGHDFSDVAAQLRSYHRDFIDLVNSGAAAYTDAETDATALLATARAPIQSLLADVPTAASSLGVSNVYQDLWTNTASNVQSLASTWSADPAPFLRQIVTNEQVYAREIGADLAGFVQRLPASLGVQVRAVVQALAAFDPVTFLNRLVNNQIGYLQTIGTSISAAAQDFSVALDALPAAYQSAYQALVAGDIDGAFGDITSGLGNLFLTGFDVQQTGPSTFSVAPTGTLGDLLPIFSIPGEIAQNFTDLVVAPSVAGQVSQDFTNVIKTLTDTSIASGINLVEFGLTADFGLPLALGVQALGGPVGALSAANTSVTAFAQAVQAANGQAALGALFDAPGVIANGYLNGETTITLTMSVAGLPIELNLPLDGILVPQGSYTATILGIPVAVTGTPIGGIVPALVNYLPQQLAAAITPAG